MISLEKILRMIREVLNESKGTRLSDALTIFDKTGIDGVLDTMREHINYVFDNIDDDSVPLAVTLTFAIGIVRTDPEPEEETE